jgi:hypothetical protein
MSLLLLLRSAPVLPALDTEYRITLSDDTRTYEQTITGSHGATYGSRVARLRRVEYKTGG